MKALLKKKIREVKKRMKETKSFLRHSRKTIGPDPSMERAYTRTMIKHRSALNTLEGLLEEV